MNEDTFRDIVDRLTALSDQLNHPQGLLARKLEEIESNSRHRHEMLMGALRNIADRVLDHEKMIGDLRQDADDLELEFRVMKSETRHETVQ